MQLAAGSWPACSTESWAVTAKGRHERGVSERETSLSRRMHGPRRRQGPLTPRAEAPATSGLQGPTGVAVLGCGCSMPASPPVLTRPPPPSTSIRGLSSVNTLITEAGPGRAHLTCKATSPGKVASDALGAGLGSGQWRSWRGGGGRPSHLDHAPPWPCPARCCGLGRRRARCTQTQARSEARGRAACCVRGRRERPLRCPGPRLCTVSGTDHTHAPCRARGVCCCFSPAPAAAPAADRPLGAAAARMRIRWEAPRRCVSWAVRVGGCVGLAARPHGKSGRYYR